MNPTPMTGKVTKQAKSAPDKSSASKSRVERAGGRPVSHGADTQVPGWVAFVGAGPGDENLLTVRAAALIGRADLVVAPQWVGERLGHLLKPGATLADSDAQLADPKLLIKAAKAGQLAVRLYSGDPFMFCNAAAEAAACAKARVPFEVVPGVSAATAVPEYAGIPLTTDATGDVRIIHAIEVSRVSVSDGTLVILGAESGPVDLGKMLIAAGWAETSPFSITWNGTTTDQHTVVGTLGTIAADLKAAGVSLLTAHGPAVAVVGDGVSAQHALSWFETKPLFGWRVLVPRTKEQAEEVCDLLRA
ncbi:MAG TPA: uroporphyrinogen-III C-methyltransferase, partial [Streptosporangiaceae bacterium]|nr:uroporphyrinogen-III C-methyltransferase [Streptosporangiaceae bacterium]